MRRRTMLGAVAAMAVGGGILRGDDARNVPLPKWDLHFHRDNTTLDALLEISAAKGVRFGIVEHAGTRENDYPVVLSTDEDLNAYIDTMADRPCWCGVQAEWLDWASCFSKATLARLDYTLGDAMTVRGPGGKRTKLWLDYEIGDVDRFMDMYAEFHVEVISTQPLDILANPTWLPDALAPRHDELWTERRLRPIVDALAKHRMALEINSQYLLPHDRMLAMAKAARVKFSFGSNIRGPEVGKLDYCLAAAKKHDITVAEMFVPGDDARNRR